MASAPIAVRSHGEASRALVCGDLDEQIGVVDDARKYRVARRLRARRCRRWPHRAGASSPTRFRRRGQGRPRRRGIARRNAFAPQPPQRMVRRISYWGRVGEIVGVSAVFAGHLRQREALKRRRSVFQRQTQFKAIDCRCAANGASAPVEMR